MGAVTAQSPGLRCRCLHSRSEEIRVESVAESRGRLRPLQGRFIPASSGVRIRRNPRPRNRMLTHGPGSLERPSDVAFFTKKQKNMTKEESLKKLGNKLNSNSENQALIYVDTPENILTSVAQIAANRKPTAPNKGGRPVAEEPKNKVISIRMTQKLFEKITRESYSQNYSTPGAYILDVLQKKRTQSNFAPYNPEVYRLLYDIEEALAAYKSLLERAKATGNVLLAQEVKAELDNFNIFVYGKCSHLVEQMRYEFFNRQ